MVFTSTGNPNGTGSGAVMRVSVVLLPVTDEGWEAEAGNKNEYKIRTAKAGFQSSSQTRAATLFYYRKK